MQLWRLLAFLKTALRAPAPGLPPSPPSTLKPAIPGWSERVEDWVKGRREWPGLHAGAVVMPWPLDWIVYEVIPDEPGWRPTRARSDFSAQDTEHGVKCARCGSIMTEYETYYVQAHVPSCLDCSKEVLNAMLRCS